MLSLKFTIYHARIKQLLLFFTATYLVWTIWHRDESVTQSHLFIHCKNLKSQPVIMHSVCSQRTSLPHTCRLRRRSKQGLHSLHPTCEENAVDVSFQWGLLCCRSHAIACVNQFIISRTQALMLHIDPFIEASRTAFFFFFNFVTDTGRHINYVLSGRKAAGPHWEPPYLPRIIISHVCYYKPLHWNVVCPLLLTLLLSEHSMLRSHTLDL